MRFVETDGKHARGMMKSLAIHNPDGWAVARRRLPTAIAWLEEGLKRGDHVGIQLSAQCGDDEPVLASTGWAAPGIPMRDDTLVVPLCAGKPMVAAAAVRAMDQQLVSPTDPLSRFLPGLRGSCLDDVTIAASLSHSIDGVDPAKQPEMDDYLVPLCQAADMVLSKVSRTPDRSGDKGLYLSWPFTLVGALLEVVYGTSLDVVMRQEVFEPLGLTDTWMGMPQAVAAEYVASGRMASLYDCNGEEPEVVPIWEPEGPVGFSRPVPTMGVRNPCYEMGRFYRALMLAREGRDNDWLSSPAAWMMTTRHRAGMPEADSGAMIDFGLGVELESRHYDKTWMSFGPHCALSTFGHKGMSCYITFCDPSRRIVVATYINGRIQGMAHGRRVFVLAQKIYEDFHAV
jgi:CubicO group peptidase (beta-lactamase class C family)